MNKFTKDIGYLDHEGYIVSWMECPCPTMYATFLHAIYKKNGAKYRKVFNFRNGNITIFLKIND